MPPPSRLWPTRKTILVDLLTQIARLKNSLVDAQRRDGRTHPPPAAPDPGKGRGPGKRGRASRESGQSGAPSGRPPPVARPESRKSGNRKVLQLKELQSSRSESGRKAHPLPGKTEPGELPSGISSGAAAEFRGVSVRSPLAPPETPGSGSHPKRNLRAGRRHHRDRPPIRSRGRIRPGGAAPALHRPEPSGKPEGD